MEHRIEITLIDTVNNLSSEQRHLLAEYIRSLDNSYHAPKDLLSQEEINLLVQGQLETI